MEKEETNLQNLLADNLVYYRKASGLTQSELAKKLNYSDKSISKWERGEGFPDIFVLKSLADFYGITVNDFYATERKKVIIKKKQKRKQIYLPLLSMGILWAVVVFTFMLLSELLNDGSLFKPWLVFIYGVTASFVLLTIWASIYRLRLLRLISVSLLIWSVALSIYLSFFVMMNLNLFLIFCVAIPLQALEIIWYLFKRKSQKNR
ncbi:MAG TPA: helix-turn-helix transcriptional regulator [Erysipelotrichaceae bacterium]|nr:helix-turn-helix transcriptional regulator [Erysipelotrichaceae bacterium]